MNIGSWLEKRASLSPKRAALFDGMRCVSDYAGFDTNARSIAAWLAAQGVRAGERVAIFMENIPEYLVIQYGVWYAGAVIVPINAKLHPREAAWIINNSGASHVFVNGAKAQALEAVDVSCPLICAQTPDFESILEHQPAAKCAERAPDDLAWLFYTSGTTGQPKGVMITHRMLTLMALSYLSDVDHVSGDDTALYAAPFSHGAGLYNIMHVLKGARHVFPSSRGFKPMEIFDLAKHFGSVHLFAAPTMVKRLTQTAKAEGVDGVGLRSVIYAGGPMYLADIIEATAQFGDIFVQIYGQGECPMGITALSRDDVSDRTHDHWRARLASVGVAQSAVLVKIADKDGNEVPAGEAGDIMVQGDTVMPGYWENEEATRKAFQNGWLLTGDMGFKDAAGYVTLVDRSKDVIISGGSNIYPREVEEVLLTHPSVSEVSIVGQEHADWGEEVIAFVVVSDGFHLDNASLDAHCLASLARFKRPKQYVEIKSLPKNNYGKVLKTALRKLL